MEKKTNVKPPIVMDEAAVKRLSLCADCRWLQRHGGLIREHNHTIRMRKGGFRCPRCSDVFTACSPNEQHRIFPLWHQDITYYMELVGTHGLPEEDRPRQCPKCRQCEHTLHRHSHYKRLVCTLSHSVKIYIFRFRCPDCGYVHSVIPAFLEPYQQLDFDLQEDLVDAVQQERTVEAVAEESESLPGGGVDEHTLASLVRRWNERLTQLESGLWAWLLARTPHLTFPRSTSLWSMLRSAWQTVRERIPAFREIRFLHGLNRLCFSLTVTVHR
ncbi:MAG: DUF6431 domain-containing protein [Roseiflexus sp.]|uniref:DUF6431 domain-containing protein n=1 Tax=Roseiflexus sp. TaxID=2562120 RepID=UPI0025CF0788|nr:DUF6431 domain-containing protein [Roseiflexus sp.]MCL6543465.1 DUF6431 domain-containing protein [Roseiflexus sp.]